ncbi:MAG: hypothetical protein JWO31_2050, partial [Phycisphaerales bacterium]|nr:hypothetical protein [Phycisphaerales bacterium]
MSERPIGPHLHGSAAFGQTPLTFPVKSHSRPRQWPGNSGRTCGRTCHGATGPDTTYPAMPFASP